MRKFDKVIYILRDPRDVVLSSAHYAFSPFILSQHPHNEQNPKMYLHHRFYELLLHWLDHVEGYLIRKDLLNIQIVFYERFLYSFVAQLKEVLEHLDITLDQEDISTIKERTSFRKLQDQDHDHMRQGTHGQWVDQFTDAQKLDAEKMLGPMLYLLGYPEKNREFGRPIIGYSETITPERIQEARLVGWGNLGDQVRYAISFLKSRRSLSEKLVKGLDYLFRRGRWYRSY